MSGEVYITALDAYVVWKRGGERHLQQLITARENVMQQLADAQQRLKETDKAIDELCSLLGRVSPTVLSEGGGT